MPLDSQNMLEVIEKFPMQCREALELPRGESISEEFDKIIVNQLPTLNKQHSEYKWFEVEEILKNDSVHRYTKDYFR